MLLKSPLKLEKIIKNALKIQNSLKNSKLRFNNLPTNFICISMND